MKTAMSMLFLVLAFSGCATVRESERLTLVAGMDFTPYTAKGFLFTPEQYLGEYESVGVISISVWPAVKKYETGMNVRDSKWEIHGSGELGEPKMMVERVDTKALLQTSYDVAVRMGADAVSRFTINLRPNFGMAIPPTYYEITGFAIKRHQK